MEIIEYITCSQPTPQDINNTPEPVRKYIRALEKALLENILHK